MPVQLAAIPIAKAIGGFIVQNLPWKDIGKSALRLQVSEGMSCSAASVSAINKCLPDDQKPFSRQTLAYFIGAFIFVEYTTTLEDASAKWLREPEEVVDLLTHDLVNDDSASLAEQLLHECEGIASIPTLFPEITKSVRDDDLSSTSDGDNIVKTTQRKSLIRQVSDSASQKAKTAGRAATSISRLTKQKTVGAVVDIRQTFRTQQYIELYHDVLINNGLGSSEVRKILMAKFHSSIGIDKVMRRTTKLNPSK